MARILLATVPVIGHIAPLLPLCRALSAHGHDVAWYTGAAYRSRVEAAGARFFGYQQAREYDDSRLDEEFPQRKKFKGIQQLIFDMKHVFIDASTSQCADLTSALQTFPADVVVAESGTIGALFAHEKTKTPTIFVGVMPMLFSSVDTAPFGFGVQPLPGSLGRLRNRAMNAFVQRLVFGGVQKYWNETRARLGLPPTGWWMDAATRATAYLQPTIPAFEYPRSDLPSSVRFIGMFAPERPADVAPPDFWHELDGGRPVVHVTQGTIANSTPDLIQPALDGLSTEDVLVVVSTGRRPVHTLGLKNVPRNARIATFLSHPDLLPKTHAMVTNGGYGGVQLALSYGVPLAVAGRTEDKPEVAARVAWSGAGIDLKTAKPTAAAVRAAVRRLLDEPRYKLRARELAAEHARYDAVSLAMEAIHGVLAANQTNAWERAQAPGVGS
jgi:MGT family glycosyltransferase